MFRAIPKVQIASTIGENEAFVRSFPQITRAGLNEFLRIFGQLDLIIFQSTRQLDLMISTTTCQLDAMISDGTWCHMPSGLDDIESHMQTGHNDLWTTENAKSATQSFWTKLSFTISLIETKKKYQSLRFIHVHMMEVSLMEIKSWREREKYGGRSRRIRSNAETPAQTMI